MKVLKTSIPLFLFIIITIFSSCANKEEYSSSDFFSMNTYVSVISDSDEDAISSVKDLILEKERFFSRTNSSSEIYSINESTHFLLSHEALYVIDMAYSIAENTQGAFNPCMGQVVNLWDITGKKYIPDSSELKNAVEKCKYKDCIIDNGTITKPLDTKFDLGACVKGYTAQLAIELFKKKNVSNAMISIGGNIAVTGSAPERKGFWRVGIKNPFSPDEVACYIDCTDKIISVSGDYERYFIKDNKLYHHIFDPSTGYPVDNDIKSVVVIAKDGLVSDALSTALFVMGKEKAVNFYNSGVYDFETVIFTYDNKVYISDGIKNNVKFLTSSFEII